MNDLGRRRAGYERFGESNPSKRLACKLLTCGFADTCDFNTGT